MTPQTHQQKATRNRKILAHLTAHPVGKWKDLIAKCGLERETIVRIVMEKGHSLRGKHEEAYRVLSHSLRGKQQRANKKKASECEGRVAMRDEARQEVLRLAQGGATVPDIVAVTHFDRNSVRTILANGSLAVNPAAKGPRQGAGIGRYKGVVARIMAGKETKRDIAADIGVSYESLQKHLIYVGHGANNNC